MENNCCIVIPIYKEVNKLKFFERESIKQCIKILGNNYYYDIYLIAPNSLDTDSYINEFKYKFFVKKFPDNNFDSTYTYSVMLTSSVFYNKFNKYKYMMIYQLDGWIFYDNLKYFMDLGFDWYGSPWVIDGIEAVGNGGVSLRKISSIIEVCKKYRKTSNMEDQYFCIAHKDKLNIAPLEVALEFGLCSNSHNKYFIENIKCPMVCHQPYNSNHINYWSQYIPFIKEKKTIYFNKDSINMNDYSKLFTSILNG